FMLEVWPFRHLLHDNLIEETLCSYLVSSDASLYHSFPIRIGNINVKIDSVIINKRTASLLAKWIDKKAIDDKDSKEIKYNFNLLLRGSVDGFSSQAFHQKCDNKGTTIVIAKISDSNKLVG
ncbi:549_t:CDS:1, partial [Gigaspora rosea]